MEKKLTPLQHDQLNVLEKLSNVVSNEVWIARNTDRDVDERILMGIWLAKHFLEEIEKIKARHAAGQTSSHTQ